MEYITTDWMQNRLKNPAAEVKQWRDLQKMQNNSTLLLIFLWETISCFFYFKNVIMPKCSGLLLLFLNKLINFYNFYW